MIPILYIHSKDCDLVKYVQITLGLFWQGHIKLNVPLLAIFINLNTYLHICFYIQSVGLQVTELLEEGVLLQLQHGDLMILFTHLLFVASKVK